MKSIIFPSSSKDKKTNNFQDKERLKLLEMVADSTVSESVLNLVLENEKLRNEFKIFLRSVKGEENVLVT